METSEPFINEDGDHIYPVTAIRRFRDNPHENSSGEVCWNHREGVTFRFELPAISLSDVCIPPPPAKGGSGSLHPISKEPEWTATLTNGTEIFLCGAIERQTGRVTFGTEGSSAGRTMRGSAAFAKVTLGRNNLKKSSKNERAEIMSGPKIKTTNRLHGISDRISARL